MKARPYLILLRRPLLRGTTEPELRPDGVGRWLARAGEARREAPDRARPGPATRAHLTMVSSFVMINDDYADITLHFDVPRATGGPSDPGRSASRTYLFGPRQTGKSTPRPAHGSPMRWSTTSWTRRPTWRLSQQPGRIEPGAQEDEKKSLSSSTRSNGCPDLLNEVHRLIEERGLRFLLTGSSARKLRAGGVNLLGRSRADEVPASADLGRARPRASICSRAVARGLLPRSTSRTTRGRSRCLRRHLSAAGNRRRRRDAQCAGIQSLLEVAALCNGTIVNFTRSPTTRRSRAPRSTSTSRSSGTR